MFLDGFQRLQGHAVQVVPWFDEVGLKDKIATVAREIYGADGVAYAPAALKAIKKFEEMGFGNLPVCMAKTGGGLAGADWFPHGVGSAQ